MTSRRSEGASTPPQIEKTPGAFPSSPRIEPETAPISAPQSLSLAVKARRSEYVRKKTIKVKVGSWNVAALSGTDLDLGAWFVGGAGVRGLHKDLSGPIAKHITTGEQDAIESVEDQEKRRTKKEPTVPHNDVPAGPAGDDIGLYVLGLQEVVDITSPSEALRPFADQSTAKRWRTALEEALLPGYENIAEQQMSGLLLLIYASPEVAGSIGSVSTTSVGTGLMGYMRNKGAVCARLVLGETTRLVFVNCHLAAGSDKAALDRRNWDVGQILSRIRFEPMKDDDEATEQYGDAIGDEDVGFWFGDLNYRLDDVPGEDVRRLLLLHTRNEYDILNKSKRKIDTELGLINANGDSSSPEADRTSQHSKESKESKHTEESTEFSDDEVDDLPSNPESDPASLHTTLQSLLVHDQLRDQQKRHKAFHDGWREGDVNFLPTYKYDIGSVGMFDSGDKKRSPSWCDRILFRTRQDRFEAEQRRKEEEEAKKRDDEMKERGLDQPDEDIIFECDPGTPGFPGTPGYAAGDYNEEEDGAGGSAAEAEEGGRSGADGAILLEHYGSHQRVLSSDHKPLDAVFILTYDAAIPELKAKVHQEVARGLDKQENEGRPGVTVVVDHQRAASDEKADKSADRNEMNDMDFGKVRYGVCKSAGLTVANTSGVTATFLFLDRPVGSHGRTAISPDWLKLEVEGHSNNHNSNANALQEYTLLPGETVYVHLSADVQTFKLVRKLNEGQVKLDDVLVLRVKEGRDHFVSVCGKWMQSCFCRTLDELLLVPEGGVRQLQRADGETAASPGSLEYQLKPSQQQKLSAPRELYALTEALQDLAQRVVAEWDMTHGDGAAQPPWKEEKLGFGWPFESRSWTLPPSPERTHLLISAREALDTGSSPNGQFPCDTSTLHRLEILAEILVTFLDSLQDGIITAELWAQLESHLSATSKASSSDTESQPWILDILSSSPVHNVAFTFITFMLANVANEIAPVHVPFHTGRTSHGVSDPTSPPKPPDQQASPPAATAGSTALSSILPSSATSATESVTNNLRPGISFSLPSFRSRRSRSRASTSGSASVEDAVIGEEASRRPAVEQAYADIFAEAMIHKPASMKDRKATRERMRRVLLPFLRG